MCLLNSFLIFSQIRFNINMPIGIDTTLDIGNNVIETKTHHFVACGLSSSPFNNFNSAYVVKIDSLGNLIWKKQYDFSIGGSDVFKQIIELADSTYILGGISSNTVTNLDESFLTKLDTGGNIVWHKKYAYPNSNEQCKGIQLTPDNKVLIIGDAFTATGLREGLLIKTDTAGNLIWRKTITTTTTYDEVYYKVDVIKNNQEYIIGGMKGYYDGTGNSFFDFDLIRTDTAGNVLWQQQYGLPTMDETGNGGTPTLDSGYVLCGTYNNEAGILKIDKNGTLQWFKNYGFSNYSIMYQVIQLPDSSFMMITSATDWDNTNRTGYLIKTDKNGNLLWQRKYPHPPTSPNIPNYFFDFNTTADKGFIITGQYNHIGQPYQNMWLVKTDSMGCDSVGGCSYITKLRDMSDELGVFKIYPNPAAQSLIIENEFLNDNTELKIINTIGEVIYVAKVLNKTTLVDLNTFNNGIYFITIADKEKKLLSKNLLYKNKCLRYLVKRILVASSKVNCKIYDLGKFAD